MDQELLQRRWAPTLHSQHSADLSELQPVETGQPTEQPTEQPSVDEVRAFVTNISGKTLISAPASTVAPQLASGPNPSAADIAEQHLLWIRGRFVGSEEANRNGALWSAGDLELGQASVAHGPLNWLHEARHVIGTLAETEFVDTRGKELADLDPTGPRHPHITATAAVWKWIWPDEAYVIERASDVGKLWYSMECISKEVACSGEGGCGASTSYDKYIAGAACEHVRQRASVRRFVNPTFLGGAVIVPPASPGWAQAQASVMRDRNVTSAATGLAEAAYEQAGKPEVSASEWEQMMAQLVLYASQG